MPAISGPSPAPFARGNQALWPTLQEVQPAPPAITRVLLTNNAEGGTAGTTVTTGNSGGASGNNWDGVTIGSGATNQFDNTHAAHGNLSYQIATGSTAAQAYLSWTASMGTPAATWSPVWSRFYFWSSGNPAATQRLYGAFDSSAVVGAALRLGTTGLLSITNSANTQIGVGALAIPANQWVRIETVFYSGWAACTCNLYSSNPEGTTPDDTFTTSVSWNGNPTATVRYGQCAGSIANFGPFWFDDIGASNSGPLGPVGATPRSSGYTLAQRPVVVLNGTRLRRNAYGPLAFVSTGPVITPTPVVARRAVVLVRRGTAFAPRAFTQVIAPAPTRAAPVVKRTRPARALAPPVFITTPTIVTSRTLAVRNPARVRKTTNIAGGIYPLKVSPALMRAVRPPIVTRRFVTPQRGQPTVTTVFAASFTEVADRPPQQVRKPFGPRRSFYVPPIVVNPVSAIRARLQTRKLLAGHPTSFVTPGTVVAPKPVSAVRAPRQVRKGTAARPASFVTPSAIIVTRLVSAIRPLPSTRQTRGSRAASFVSAAAIIVTRQTKAVRSPPVTRKDIGSGGDVGATFVTSPAVIVVHPVYAVRAVVPTRKPSGDKGAAFVTVTTVVVTQPVRAARTRSVIRRGVTSRGQSTAVQPQTPQFIVAERNALPLTRKRFPFFRGQTQVPAAAQFTIAERNALPQTRKRLAFFKGTPAPPIPVVPGRVRPIKVPPQTRKLPRAYYRGIPTPPVPIRVRFTQAILGIKRRIHFPGTGFGTKYIPPPPPLFAGGTVIAFDSLVQTVIATDSLAQTVLATDKVVGTVIAADSLAQAVVASDQSINSVSALDYYL